MQCIYCKFNFFNVTVTNVEEQMVRLMRTHPNLKLVTIEIPVKTYLDSRKQVIVLEKKDESIEKIVKSRDVYCYE